MNRAEFIQLESYRHQPSKISVEDLKDKSERTLLYGYSTDVHAVNRSTWHVFLFKNEIYCYCYAEITDNTAREFYRQEHAVTWPDASVLIPNKRLYPEACDFEFCLLLKQRGFHLPFTIYNPNRNSLQFHGLI